MKTFNVITGFKMENRHNQSIRGLSVLNTYNLAETCRITFVPSPKLCFSIKTHQLNSLSCRFISTAGYKYWLQLSNNSYLRNRAISFCVFHANVFNKHICTLKWRLQVLQVVVSKDKINNVNYCSRMAAVTENLDANCVLLWSQFRNMWIRQWKVRPFSELQCVMVCQHL